jgi:hypothetical protein
MYQAQGVVDIWAKRIGGVRRCHHTNDATEVIVRRLMVAFGIVVISVMAAAPSAAQECSAFAGVYFDDSIDECRSGPFVNRAFYPGIIRWQDQHFLYQSTGNDLEFLDLSFPATPNDYEDSSWHGSIGNQGDNDFGLEAIAVCDECRYGVAFYRMATVFFDLGTEDRPRIAGASIHSELPGLPYGLTFSHRGTQFLVAQRIGPSPCEDGAGLYVLDGIDPSQMVPLQCLAVPAQFDGDQMPTGGRYLQSPTLNGGTPYVWSTAGYYVATWEVVGEGEDTRLVHRGRIDDMVAFGRSGNLLGFDVDLGARMAVSTDRFGFKTWRVFDLSAPTLVATVPAHDGGNVVTLRHPLAYTLRYSGSNTGMTWDVRWAAAPAPLDDGFWSTDNTWNQNECQLREDGAVFGPDGRYLYVARHVVGHAFDISQCVDDLTLPWVDAASGVDATQ